MSAECSLKKLAQVMNQMCFTVNFHPRIPFMVVKACTNKDNFVKF